MTDQAPTTAVTPGQTGIAKPDDLAPLMKEFSDIVSAYRERSNTFNALVYGQGGTGKTYSLRTAPTPILVHSFDPGGATTNRQMIRDGLMLVDGSFEEEYAKQPRAFQSWESKFMALKRMNAFDHFGTYVLDSITMWADAMMNAIVKRKGRADSIPTLQDYLVQIITIQQYIKEIMTLPCNCIVIGHLDTDKDENTGQVTHTPMIVGKMKEKLPILFDEVYAAQAKGTSSGVEYSFLTQNSGRFQARSRLAADHGFEMYEKPDFKYLMQKAKFPVEDKDPTFLQKLVQGN